MIKRIRFATGDLPAAWRDAVAAAADAPPSVRPCRLTVCTTLADLTGPGARHDGVGIEWFTDAAHLRRFQGWLDTSTGPVIVADESIMRGADWLDQRWREGGGRYKHMALALRADGLTPAEFSARWRAHAGTAGSTVIPQDVRGRAYVQNHPHMRTTGSWAYDAVNEVYFDDADGLRARIDWFRRNLPEPAYGDLVGRSWFIAVHEEVIHA